MNQFGVRMLSTKTVCITACTRSASLSLLRLARLQCVWCDEGDTNDTPEQGNEVNTILKFTFSLSPRL
jgi:hypothetical protein